MQFWNYSMYNIPQVELQAKKSVDVKLISLMLN